MLYEIILQISLSVNIAVMDFRMHGEESENSGGTW
jgi:hypothetical protein